MRRTGVTLIAVAALAAATALLFAGSASAANFGVAVLKDCVTPINVGDPYSCEVELDNTAQLSHASVRVTSLQDVVLAAGGSQTQVYPINSSSFNLQGGLILTGGATCDATGCTVPFGGTLTTPFFSHYAAQVGDFPTLNDQATYTWNEICATSILPGCSSNTNNSQATASADINPIPTTATTAIQSNGGTVTAVESGATVSDNITVSSDIPNQPAPPGNVNLQFFTNAQCSGSSLASTEVTLDGNGQAFNALPEGPLAPGFYGYLAHYEGSADGAYLASHDDQCEPLRVVDANIQITPQQATDPVGDNHTLTGHVNVNDGSGTANAPDGTVINFSLTNSGGATATFVGPSSCTTSGGTGSCTVVISSPTAGSTSINATTTLSVAGVSLTRSTGDSKTGDSPDATKVWINPDANIQISPQSAQDPVGDTHTLTGHVNVAPDAVTFSNAPDGTLITFSIVSGPGSFVGGVNTCTTSGGTGSCTVQITSAVAGTTVIRAATDVTVSGVSLHRETNDGHTGDSSDANKTWIPPGGIIAPTQTTCNDVLNGTASTLGQINYTLSGGKIAQSINPGVFFYYTKITTTTPNQVVTVSQSNTSTNNTPLFQALNGQAWLWKGDCSSHTVGALIANGSGATFTVPTPGNYIIGIKYQTKSIVGAPAPIPANITYNFTTSLGGSTGASVLLKKQ